MDTIERISFKGGKFNEDFTASTKNAAWVLDGATGLDKNNYVHKQSDAIWFVQRWQKYLSENIDNFEIKLTEVLHQGIQQVKVDYLSLCGDQDIPPISLPSATIAICRENGDVIEYVVLGDSIMLALDKEGKTHVFQDTALGQLDKIAIDCMFERRLSSPTMSIEESKSSCMDILVKNRLSQNTPEGYWNLGFDSSAPFHALSGTIPKSEYQSIFLATDGLANAFVEYDLITVNEVFDILLNRNLLDLYRILRRAEKEDPRGITLPRLKVHDDATGIFMRI